MYFVMMLLALSGGFAGAGIILYKGKVSIKHIICMSALNYGLIIYGALLGNILIHGLGTWGLNSSGASCGLLLGILFYAYMYPQYGSVIMKAYTLMLPYMYGVGKIGCAFGGCCGGRPYSGPLHIHTVKGEVFPIQITEAVIFLILFVISILFYLKKEFEPIKFACIYASCKILLDFLRDTHTNSVITTNQIICSFVIIALIFVRKWLKTRTEAGFSH